VEQKENRLKMLQFILAKEAEADGSFTVDGRDYHYLVNVRRVKTGDEITGVLPSGETRRLALSAIDRKSCRCVLQDDHHPKDGNSGRRLTVKSIILFQALPKGTKMDLIVRQAAECGVSEIVPFIAERSVRHPKGGNLERWRRIIREARQQSGSPVATVIHPVTEEEDALGLWDAYRATKRITGLLFHPAGLENCALGLHDYLADNSIEAVALAIGAEGGFSVREMRQFFERGFKPVRLGDTVLRAETAALYAVAVVRALLLEKDSWTYNARE
jgi:16S rRNA (uracil1498-N3)-methyltransferase